MAGNSYLKVIFNSNGSSSEGRKFYLNIEPIERRKGIPTADIPIPTLSPSERILIPAGGNEDDFTLNCVFKEETSKVAANIDSNGVETDRTDVRTIQEQWDFVFDEILEISSEGGIFAIYELFIDWNSKTYQGWCQIQSSINNEMYSGRVDFRLIFKRGKNPLAFLT